MYLILCKISFPVYDSFLHLHPHCSIDRSAVCSNLISKLLSGSTGNYKRLEGKAATQEIRRGSQAEPGSVVPAGKNNVF